MLQGVTSTPTASAPRLHQHALLKCCPLRWPHPCHECDAQEDFAKKKAQREEVVALLAAPTQAAGALDVADDEGNTALLHACLHGMCSVSEQLLAAGAKSELVNKDNKTAVDLAMQNPEKMEAVVNP